MTLTMHNTRSLSIQEMREILDSTTAINFKAANRNETYDWIEKTLRNIRYVKLKKKQKGIVRRYIQKMTGLKKAQITKLIKQFKTTTQVKLKEYKRHSFPKKYTVDDIALLAEADLTLKKLNGPATAVILNREYHLFGKQEYKNISGISSSHIYNIRHTDFYRDKTRLFQKTKPRHIPIGERSKPDPEGKPGYVRVDTVHHGSSVHGDKGLYTINLVCEMTQFQIMTAAEKISEAFMVPVLEEALNQFPFKIVNFHADNGGEFINYKVAEMLQRMLIKLTKSRPRKSNDNALVESKNGSIVRKHLGHLYIPQKNAEQLNDWYRDYLNVLVNFHRPCAFGEEVIVNAKTGKRKRKYPRENYQNPYKKFKSLPHAKDYLKPNQTFEKLDKLAYAESDLEFARKVEKSRDKLFKIINS